MPFTLWTDLIRLDVHTPTLETTIGMTRCVGLCLNLHLTSCRSVCPESVWTRGDGAERDGPSGASRRTRTRPQANQIDSETSQIQGQAEVTP
jgi:hypothetical protein